MTLPTPYYDDPVTGITLYCGDACDILPLLPNADCVLTDPPYGVAGGRGLGAARGKTAYTAAFDDSPEYVRCVVVPLIAGLIATVRCVVVTPGNANLSAYPQPRSFGVFYQPAAVGLQPFGNLDAQPIFYYGTAGGSRMGKPCSWMLTETPDRTEHPCSKPLRAWRRLLATISPPGDLVLDPFAGSGTTLVSAKHLGRRAVGIEIEPAYCKIVVERLRQGVLPLEATA